MANTKISDMTAASNLVGATIPIVQSSANKKAAIGLFYTARIQSVTSSATVTPNVDTDDMVRISAQAEALTIANPGGTPTDGYTFMIEVKDNGTAQAITMGTSYRAFDAIPTTTVISKWKKIIVQYNSIDAKYDVISVIDQP